MDIFLDIPIWLPISIIAIFFAIAGTFFDKYLLQKYFEENENTGPGALVIFSAYFLLVIIVPIFIVMYEKIDFSFSVGFVGLFVGILNGMWILMYLHAIDRSEVTKTVPIFQTVPIFGLLFALLFLQEFITIPQMIAASIIISGSIILTYEIQFYGTIPFTIHSSFYHKKRIALTL